MKDGQIVCILGIDYTIRIRDVKDDPKLVELDGYCDTSTKDIVIAKFDDDVESIGDITSHQKRIQRHEIIHAFLYESGLDTCCEWAKSEDVVDWIALQFPKIMKVYKDSDSI